MLSQRQEYPNHDLSTVTVDREIKISLIL